MAFCLAFRWAALMTKHSEFAVLLGMNPLFAGLGAESINTIATLCHALRLSPGEMLFQKGDSGNELFGIRRGRIRIEINSATGTQIALNLLGAGDIFGEIAVFDGQARTADAIAEEASELFVLRRKDLMAYLEREPHVALKLIPLLCQRIRSVSERMEEAVLLPVEARLARRLCDLAADFGSDVRISQEQLGAYVGAARETVNRQLQEWRQQGILEVGRGRVLVLNASRLKAEAYKGRNTRY
jgi:CRP/FNR family cyclic AMP-dependent transcriptional regulator